MGNYDAFRKAVELTVIGEPVELESVTAPDGRVFHVTPRKYSKAHAAKIRRYLVGAARAVPSSLHAKFRAIKKQYGDELTEEIIEKELTPEEQATLIESSTNDDGSYDMERSMILYGIHEHDFGDEPAPMTEEIADMIMDSPDVAQEVLKAVVELNPPSAQK